jgi:hypothetical protein
MGKSVSLGELGTMRVSIGSKGVEKPEEFVVGMIEGAKIIFTPGVELKKQLTNLTFEKE